MSPRLKEFLSAAYAHDILAQRTDSWEVFCRHRRESPGFLAEVKEEVKRLKALNAYCTGRLKERSFSDWHHLQAMTAAVAREETKDAPG